MSGLGIKLKITQAQLLIPQPIRSFTSSAYKKTLYSGERSWSVINGGLTGVTTWLKWGAASTFFVSEISKTDLMIRHIPTLFLFAPGLQTFAYYCSISKNLLSNFFAFKYFSSDEWNGLGGKKVREQNSLIRINKFANYKIFGISINIFTPLKAISGFSSPGSIFARIVGMGWQFSLLGLHTTSFIKHSINCYRSFRTVSRESPLLATAESNFRPNILEAIDDTFNHTFSPSEQWRAAAKKALAEESGLQIQKEKGEKEKEEVNETAVHKAIAQFLNDRDDGNGSIVAQRRMITQQIGAPLFDKIQAIVNEQYRLEEALIFTACEDVERGFWSNHQTEIIDLYRNKERLFKAKNARFANMVRVASSVGNLALILVAKVAVVSSLFMASLALATAALGVGKYLLNEQEKNMLTPLEDAYRGGDVINWGEVEMGGGDGLP